MIHRKYTINVYDDEVLDFINDKLENEFLNINYIFCNIFITREYYTIGDTLRKEHLRYSVFKDEIKPDSITRLKEILKNDIKNYYYIELTLIFKLSLEKETNTTLKIII